LKKYMKEKETKRDGEMSVGIISQKDIKQKRKKSYGLHFYYIKVY
jgi:hypothetical protein